jgi:PhnB protein
VASRLNPYLNFDGTTRAAMEFYHSVFGGELAISTFGEFGAPEGVDPDGTMHAMLQTPAGFTLMASDGPPGQPVTSGSNFSISLSGDDEAELRGYWDQLAEGGQVVMPLERQMWGDTFGMCVDKFGMPWMVNIAGAGADAPA